MGRPVTINGRELNINDAPFIEANAEYSVTVDDDGTVMVERTDLKAENAKLKALVLDFVNDLYSDATLEYPHTFLRRYAKRLKEVGIEVES